MTITGSGTLEGFLELCQGRAVSREELSAAASRTREFIHTTLLYRFSRALSASEAEEFRRRVAGALELGRSRGHDFGEMEFREDHQVALVEGHLKWEDRELGATLLLAVAQFDLEVCPILGFKGTEFVNPLRAAT